MDNFQWILAYDGDNAGRLVGRAILSNDPAALSEVSDRINLGHEVVKRWAQEHGGGIISGGGDEGTFHLPHEALDNVEQLRADYQFATRLTMSVGIGKTLSEAGKSLIVAKFRGKNQVVVYDPRIETEIQQVQMKLEDGTATDAEKKQGDAYLRPEGQDSVMDGKDKSLTKAEGIGVEQAPHDCPYCQELSAQNIHDEDCPYCVAMHDPNAADHAADCPYCAVMNHDPSAADHAADCPYCQEMATHDPNMDGHEADCPYCVRSAQSVGGDNQEIDLSEPSADLLPTTQDSQNYAGQDLPAPSMDKPAAISSQPSGVAAPTDSKTNQNIILENEQGPPAAQEYVEPFVEPVGAGTTSTEQNPDSINSITNEIDAIGVDQTPLRQEGQGDDADLPGGTNMEGNVSRPESYSQDVPTDLGLGEEPDNGNPDISSVLQEGLDNHADAIQRERVVAMVGEALEGFKGCKNILERAKLEAPQLYTSSIAMLRAMIEMAKMLGLDQDAAMEPTGVAEPEAGVLEGQQPAGGMPENKPADPQGMTDQTGGHPDYNNLYPAHPESGGGADPKLQGR